MVAPVDIHASEHFVFETTKNSERVDLAHLTYNPSPQGNGYKVVWEIKGPQRYRKETYLYDGSFQIEAWNVEDAQKDSAYSAEVLDGQLRIQGRLNGALVNKRIRIEGLPLYANPKIGLIRMLRKGEKQHDFWAIRNDTLTKVHMTAVHQGTDVLFVDQKPVKAHRIYWKTKKFPSFFFHRTYWFRVRDGRYIGQKGSNQKKRRLIEER
jgi:hypothetical protein